jgi:tetratricopeptide (TPR) repeat protein
MMQMLFFLRFKNQLRRTRPELIDGLERSVARAVEAAGGKLTGERRLMTASFHKNAIGFWLDMLVLLETAIRILDDAAGDLYGYALVLGQDIEEDSAEQICRILSSRPSGGGLWLDRDAKKGLFSYVNIENPGKFKDAWTGIRSVHHPLVEGFMRVESLKIFSASRPANFPLQETIQRALTQGIRRNTLLLGPEFCGKRYGLYRFYEELCFTRSVDPEKVPPLIIRFDTGGIACLADAWIPQFQALAENTVSQEILGEINALGQGIFRERLRNELSPDEVNRGRRFFKLVLDVFVLIAKKWGFPPLIILENIHRAGEETVRIFMEAQAAFPKYQGPLIMGTCADEAPDFDNLLKTWGPVFPRMVKLNTGDLTGKEAPEISRDVWEIAYALALLGRFFPGRLFCSLFEEAGKNPAMFSRALSLLSSLGLVDSFDDPRPRMSHFISRAERALGDRKEAIRALVRNRLLNWVGRYKLSPCFRLLEALTDLGGRCEDEIILQSISSDIMNGTSRKIEEAMATDRLRKIAGAEKTRTIEFIIKTLKALHHGDERMIRAAFQELPPDCSFSPVLKAQVLANLSSFHLGVGDPASAAEMVKEGILLSQRKNGTTQSQSYRLFALVNLAKHQIGEAIDYLDFAVDHAEKSGNYHERAVSAYYAASAQFLFGNMSKAQRLARQAEIQAASSGHDEWAGRSLFLRGRLCFETGRYREALEIFEALEKNSSGLPEKEQLLAAWIYRTKIYSQNPLIAKPSGGGIEADIFEMEAAYLAGNYEKTLELSNALAGLHHEEFLFIEQPDWRSGFTSAEFLLFPGSALWDRMVSAYHALALSRLSPSGGEEAQHSMQRILRDERLSEIDPGDAFYFFAWYRVLEETGAAQVDMNTAVSMAFKRLQRRASRIDDMEVRRDFLSLPRWNAALSLAAKDYKLI